MRLLLLLLTTAFAHATQSDFYLREEIPLPPGEVMEIGSIALMPEQRIAVTTRRGDLWICSGAYADDLSRVTWKKFAQNLHEPLGMFWKDGALYLTQRPELTKITDSNQDGLADTFETLCSDWGISGDYHEYAFGSEPDTNGDIWIVLCLTGSFQGNPTGNKFHQLANLPAPPDISDTTRVLAEHLKFPNFIPPAVVLPHAKVGHSPTGIACDQSGGKFGPWENQLYIGEQTHSQVQRVYLEQINGIYQGAVFHFLDGFETGLIPIRLDQQAGILFAGGSNRGWASRGSKPFTLERVKWTGKTPFEIQTMRATPDGFTLNFTAPVDPASAGNPASYSMEAWTYIHQSGYGSPEVDQATPQITAATVSSDGKSVRLTIDGLVRGHVHYLSSKGVKSTAGENLWHPDAYYTLNEIPR